MDNHQIASFKRLLIIKEIEENHAKILENRPIPELLDTADLINGLERRFCSFSTYWNIIG